MIRKDQTPQLAELRESILGPLRQYETMLAGYLAGKKAGLRILAIDPGITNVAICQIDREYKTTFTSKIELPELGSTMTRMFYLEMIVEHWVKMFRPDLIVKEATNLGATYGVADAGKFQYAVERVAMEHLTPCLTVNNPSMRSFIGAKEKKAAKSDVKLWAFEKHGKKFNSEDEADAFAIGMTGIAIVEGEYVVNKK